MNKPYYVPTIDEIRECQGDWLFADGGLLSPNPSVLGGIWAWVRVRDGVKVCEYSGVIRPSAEVGLSAITNNISELYALCNGINNLPIEWVGKIVSDSHVTLCRRYANPGRDNMAGVPPALVLYARGSFARVVDTCDFILVDGHPKPEQLESGIGKRGNRVSKWNKFCDDACNKEKAAFLKSYARKGAE